MDQFASASGHPGAAVLLDCRSLASRVVPLPAGVAIVVVHTGVPRSLSGSAYNERRAQCEAAVRQIARVEPGVRSLRDVDAATLDRWAPSLDPVVARRARHVVAENDRVLATEAAFAAGDLATVGRLFAASHASLRDDYEVSCSELDLLVDVATSTPGVHAARMTGAGFGGCIVALADPAAITVLVGRIDGEYAVRSGRTPRVWVVQAVAGAGTVDAR
jgi:galactokinase